MVKPTAMVAYFSHDIPSNTTVELVYIPFAPFPSELVDESRQASVRCEWKRNLLWNVSYPPHSPQSTAFSMLA